MESEYENLSKPIWDFLPFKQLVNFIFTGVGLEKNQDFNTRFSLFEDNAGALALANLKLSHMTNISKHHVVNITGSEHVTIPRILGFWKWIHMTIGQHMYKKFIKVHIRKWQGITNGMVIKLAFEKECWHIYEYHMGGTHRNPWGGFLMGSQG